MAASWVRRLLPLLIIIGAVVVGASFTLFNSHPPKKVKVQPRPAVDVVAVVAQPIQVLVNSQGTVSASRSIEWASEVTGRVTWVSPAFMNGNAVEEGAPLLRLDDTDYRVAVAQAEAALADAELALQEERAEMRRGAAYNASRSASASSLRQPKLAQVEASHRAAEETLKQAQQDLAATEVVAPFAGVIDNKQADLGQYVTSGAVLFHLYGTDVAEVRLPVTAADIGFLRAGVSATGETPRVILSASIGKQMQQWRGKLVREEQRVDAETRTFYVVAEVEQPYNRERYATPLTLGLFVDAQIEGVVIDSAVRLPKAAIHNSRYVYLVEEGRLQQREVGIYRHEQMSVVVERGLSDGEQVVLTQLDLMVDGMPVTAVPLNPDPDLPAPAAGGSDAVE